MALRGLGGFLIISRGIGAFLRFTFFKPLQLLGRGLFRLLLPLYAWYTQLKRRFRTSPHTAGIRTFGQLMQRYSLYMIIVAFGIFGLATNLLARTVRPDEVGQGSLWTALVTGDSSELIVETRSANPNAAVMPDAVGGPALINANVTESADPATTSQTVEQLGAVAALEQTGDSPRQTVETYTVKGGDTVSTIASDFGISSRTILWANGLGENDYIKPSQVLKIPSTTGYLYTVKSGDTVTAIAKKYKGQEDEILAANSLPLADALQSGQEIIIPGGEPPAPPAPPPSRAGFFGQIFVRGENAPPSAAATGARFIWPTPGRRVNQYYRGRWHTGLDIDGEYSSPIYAAAGGVVSYASADRSGYGLHVIVSHGNGLTTMYAHASKVYVKSGQSVRQGQTIAMQGCTGRCSGVHLHFEIRRGGVPVNPLSYY